MGGWKNAILLLIAGIILPMTLAAPSNLNISGTVYSGGLTIVSGTVSLPGNQIDSSEVNFNYAGSASKGGAATTASALAANGANCAAGSFPLGVDASGAVESCSTGITGNAATATALAADGSNCGAGQYAQGIDAAGNAQGCAVAAVAWSSVTSKPASWLDSTTLTQDLADFNTAVPSGFYQQNNGANAPTAGTWYNMINVRHANAGNLHGFQLAAGYYDENIWSRTYQGNAPGTFTPWRKIWNQANDGSGSGLDADTLDGSEPGSLSVAYAASTGNAAACSIDGTCEAQSLGIGSTTLTSNWMEFGPNDGATGVGIDMHGGSSYSDYTARFYRAAGDNGVLQLLNRGTGGFDVGTQDGSTLRLITSNSARMTVLSTGEITTATRIVLSSSNDGRTNGLWFWGNADSNWAVYMAQPGAGTNPAGSTMTNGYWNNGHSIRFRSGNGISVERYTDNVLTLDMDNEGNIYHRGQVRAASFYPGNQATDYLGHDGGGITKYGTGYTYFNGGAVYVNNALHARGAIDNDQGDVSIADAVKLNGNRLYLLNDGTDPYYYIYGGSWNTGVEYRHYGGHKFYVAASGTPSVTIDTSGNLNTGNVGITGTLAVSGNADFNYGEIEIQGTQSSKAPFLRFHRPNEEFGQIRYGTDASHDGVFYFRNMNGNSLARISINTPVNANDATTKAYVDGLISGTWWAFRNGQCSASDSGCSTTATCPAGTTIQGFTAGTCSAGAYNSLGNINNQGGCSIGGTSCTASTGYGCGEGSSNNYVAIVCTKT